MGGAPHIQVSGSQMNFVCLHQMLYCCILLHTVHLFPCSLSCCYGPYNSPALLWCTVSAACYPWEGEAAGAASLMLKAELQLSFVF